MLFYTSVYDDVQSKIVSILCLSCIKLDPKTSREFTFETIHNTPHPAFVLDNLTKGPIFLAFRKDVCEFCDIMEPIIKEIFDLDFEKEETFHKTVNYTGSAVTFIHINIDHSPTKLRESLFVYDKDEIGGVPMFTIITLGYDRGFVKPYYTTLYGVLNLDKNEERKELLTTIIQESVALYRENHAGHDIG
jgi:thiol-disulfide isomerase/thioredoxin